MFERFSCLNLNNKPYTEFVTDIFEKRDFVHSTEKSLLQNLAKNIGLSIWGGIIGKDISQEYKYVTETWMRENFDDRVKKGFLLKNGLLKVKLEDDKGIDDYDKAKMVNTMTSHFDCCILSNSKKLMNDVIKRTGGFYKNSI